MEVTIAQMEEDLHPIFKVDPSTWWQYLGQKVRLTAAEKVIREGWVYTIDPVTQNWVLFILDDHAEEPCVSSICVVMQSVVERVDVISSECPSSVDKLMASIEAEGSIVEENMEERCNALYRWFEANRIPVQKCGSELVIADGVLTVQAPYSNDSCLSSNEIILARIRALIQTMPNGKPSITD